MAWQFRVYGRKTLFSLLILFVIPPGDCSAQTPAPPIDEHAFKRVPPTVVERLATHFSLGAFAGRFEETPLGAVREAVGEGTINTRGTLEVASTGFAIGAHTTDYGSCPAERWAAQTIASQRSLKLTKKDPETSTDCAVIPEKFVPLIFDGKLQLGMSRSEVVTALGSPSKLEAAHMSYYHDGKLADGFDETAWLILRFRAEKLVSMRGGKTTTN